MFFSVKIKKRETLKICDVNAEWAKYKAISHKAQLVPNVLLEILNLEIDNNCFFEKFS